MYETYEPTWVSLKIHSTPEWLDDAQFGLGTCWIGRLNADEAIKKALGIPEHIKVVAVTPIGYPDETPGPKIRKPHSEIIHYDRFQEDYTPQLYVIQ